MLVVSLQHSKVNAMTSLYVQHALSESFRSELMERIRRTNQSVIGIDTTVGESASEDYTDEKSWRDGVTKHQPNAHIKNLGGSAATKDRVISALDGNELVGRWSEEEQSGWVLK